MYSAVGVTDFHCWQRRLKKNTIAAEILRHAAMHKVSAFRIKLFIKVFFIAQC
jgi:hypothetical protein